MKCFVVCTCNAHVHGPLCMLHVCEHVHVSVSVFC